MTKLVYRPERELKIAGDKIVLNERIDAWDVAFEIEPDYTHGARHKDADRVAETGSISRSPPLEL